MTQGIEPTKQLFPSRRSDGSAEVAAVFHAPLDEVSVAVADAVAEWRAMLEGVDLTADLASDPRVVPTEAGFRVVFDIRPGSRRWRDWAVALIGTITDHLGQDAWVGFFDAVKGQMHRASRGTTG